MSVKNYANIDTLRSFLDNLKATFAPKSHKHTISELTDYVVDTELSSTSTNPVQNNVVTAEFNAISDTIDDLELAIDEKADITDVSANYNESIIGLSVDGRTVTYIKGDGSVHTFETQDTDTTYSLGTDEVTGLTKLYATVGNAEDGTMTQKAIKTELDKKVGVTIDSAQNTLIFTI